ncbi:MAG: sugar ABC transporter permease [Clostridiales bacterium]|nr:sugar ABC transporter permease [Clostridiales bacterium]
MKKEKQGFAYAMTLPAIVVLIALSVFPLGYTIKNSFTDYYLLAPDKAKWVGFSNYIQIVKDPFFRLTVKNTLLFTVVGVFFETTLGIVLAVFADSFKKGKKLLRILLMLPMLLPPVTVALVWQTMFSNNNGILNQILGFIGMTPVNWLQDVKTALPSILVIDIWQYTPLAFLLAYASIQTVSTEQYEAASLDGANGWKRFWYITLPNILSGVRMVVLLRVIDTFRLFDKVNILTKGGPANSTATITQYIYQYGTKNFQMGYASAASMIMTVIVVLMSAVYLKQSLKEMK